MTQCVGGLGRIALQSNRLRPLSILRLWGIPNLERPQSFRGSRLKKIEAFQHFGILKADVFASISQQPTLRTLNLWEA